MSKTNELYSLLIPLRDGRMLVPRACIAEVIAFAESPRGRGAEDAPAWYLGSIDWNGRSLPIVSLDDTEEELPARRRSRRRIVVFHGLTDRLKGRHYGILTVGFPQLVRVNPDVLSLDDAYEVPPDKPYVCRARMIHEFPFIPDVDRLEAMIADVTSQELA
jgi:chemosensory pili system protein ChpC